MPGQVRHVFRTLGRYQTWQVTEESGGTFAFMVTTCNFAATMRDLGLGDLIGRICDADRAFWNERLRHTGLRFAKDEGAIARDGSACQTSFTAT